MKKPDNWNEFSLMKQEKWLIAEKKIIDKLAERNFRELGQIRGGHKLIIIENDKLDDFILKSK
jgi:hypothetical protein